MDEEIIKKLKIIKQNLQLLKVSLENFRIFVEKTSNKQIILYI